MISITYDQRCEAFRFAWRNIRFVFAVFAGVEARNEMEWVALKVGVREKLHKRAAKFLKSQAGVNLCAGGLPVISRAVARVARRLAVW
jgi:hypothetical protein